MSRGKKTGRFRSGLEKRVYEESLKGARARYETLDIPYVKQHRYRPDFILPNGGILEVKGRFTAQDRSKHLAVQKLHPNLDIRFVFGADNTLSKNSKTRYSEWCIKKGFKYCFIVVPPEWLKEKRKEIQLEDIST